MNKSRLDQNIDFGTLLSVAFNKITGYVNIVQQRSLLKDKSLV